MAEETFGLIAYTGLSAVSSDTESAAAAADRAEAAAEAADGSAGALIASAFSTSTAYAVGDYVVYSGALYRFTSAHAAGAWDASDVVEVTVGDELAGVKSAINQIDGILDIANDTTEIPVHVHASGNSLTLYSGVIYAHTESGNYRDDYAVTAGDTVLLNAISDGTIEYVYCFTNRDLANGSATVIANSYTQTTETSVELIVPEGAAYLFVTAVNEVTVKALAVAGKKSERLDGIESVITGLESDVSEMRATVSVIDESLKDVAKSVGKNTMYVETWSAFPFRKVPVSFTQDTPFVVSGNSDSNTVTIISGGAALSESDINSGIVIKHDNGMWSTHLITAYTSNTISIFPALTSSVTEGTLAPFAYDTQHLTKQGYKAYMQHIDNANPKHCEKHKYVARFAANSAADLTAQPFTLLSGSPSFYGAARNDGELIIRQYGNYCATIIPYTNYSTEGEYGCSWEVSTGNAVGYLETFVGVDNTSANGINEKDEGYYMHIEVYADDVLIFSKLKTNNVIERICVDYTASQDKVKIKVYYTKMRNGVDTIAIGATTLWINEDYPSAIFPTAATVDMFFDSWGAYHGTEIIEQPADGWHVSANWSQGCSGEDLKDIMANKAGFQTPVFNTSKAGETSRWGRAWFGVAVREHVPNVVVTDFGINDYHTTMATFPDSYGPYGETISMSSPLTPAEYTSNMSMIFDMAKMSGIRPVFVEPNIGSSIEWTLTLINSLASQIE